MIPKVREGRKIRGTVGKFWKENRTSSAIKRVLYERVSTPILVRGSEKCSLSAEKRGNLELFAFRKYMWRKKK